MSEMLPASPGNIRAYDAHSGQLRWSFPHHPSSGRIGLPNMAQGCVDLQRGCQQLGGHGDRLKRGVVFVPTGSAASDFYGANRVGDDCSRLA